jgi:ATP-binding cassette, subfamily A (ABC1), member 3
MGLLTAEFPPTSGDAILGGFSVTHEPQRIRRLIGYCPQFDALYGCLTAREHLLLYGAVKGIPKYALAEAATKKLQEVGLHEADWDRASSGFSGGMKRRLSLACATMGQPKLIFLDECSTGVDPVSRREIWQLVSNMVAGHGLPQHEKPSMILTTHSMDECEALCPRIGIMANGRLRCLGSAQHLKNKFGQGYQVELNLKMIKVDDIDYSDVVGKLNDIVLSTSLSEIQGLNLSRCKEALNSLAGDESLSSLISVENPSGSSIWKDATSPIGVSLKDLSIFVVTEHRIRRLEEFVRDTFPEYVLREREDTRVRYEVCGPELRISEIFTKIEDHKQSLLLADYGVSQTSLEQVFNMHAAKAESLKEDRIVPATPLLGTIITQAEEGSGPAPLVSTVMTQNEEGSIEMYC